MEMTTYENGVPCWTDLMTTDRGKAIAFHTGLGGIFSVITLAST